MTSVTTTWQQLAGDAAPLEERIERLAPDRQQQVRAVLEQVATQPATPDGVAKAWQLVADALPGLERPNFSGSGEGPNRSALRGAAKAVLGSLVGRAAASMTRREDFDALLTTLKGLPAMRREDLETLTDEARSRFKG